MNRFTLPSALFALLASSCSLTAYKAEISQGNAGVFEKIEGLEEGDTREAVRDLLGPPHHVGEYRPNRWHYFSYVRTSEPTSERRRLTLVFDDADGGLAEVIVEDLQVENDY